MQSKNGITPDGKSYTLPNPKTLALLTLVRPIANSL